MVQDFLVQLESGPSLTAKPMSFFVGALQVSSEVGQYGIPLVHLPF